MNYIFHITTYFTVYAMLALSLNMIVGYCGLITLAHASFFAIGGYTCAILTIGLDWAFLPAAGVSSAIAALASITVSVAARKLEAGFFVLTSLAVQMIVFSAIRNWGASDAPVGTLQNLTNGSFGISSIPNANIAGHSISTPMASAALGICLCVLSGFLIWRIVTSPWGRLAKCMRDDRIALRNLGKSPHRLTVQAHLLACGVAGLAGAFYATYVGYIDPSSAALQESLLVLSMVLVGGIGNLIGPLLGAGILVSLPELLRFIDVSDAVASSIRLMVYGLLLILAMLLRPQGLAGEYGVD